MRCRVSGGPAPGGCHNHGVPSVDPAHLAQLVAGVDDNSAAYDLVLLAHVVSAVVSMVALVVAGGFALALRGALGRGGPLPASVVRYFRPGVNWVGRVLFLVPVLGVALVAMSGGQWGYADGWVTAGLGAWVVVALVAEGVLWPDERRLQEVVAARESAPGTGTGPEGVAAGVPAASGTVTDPAGVCLRSGLVGIGLAVALVAVAVLMVAKP
jgi:hypothetical protein